MQRLAVRAVRAVGAGWQGTLIVPVLPISVVIKTSVVVIVAIPTPPVIIPTILIIFHRGLRAVVTDPIQGPLAGIVADITIWFFYYCCNNNRFVKDDLARTAVDLRDLQFNPFIILQVVAPRSISLEF
jgi:hypothetical protein